MSERPVTTDALETLGSIITANEKRDAIHLAVENVVAHERLRAGEGVFLDVDGLARFANPGGSAAIGIVDPFLTVPVAAGDHFWLVVMPRQITSLRHVWEHPSFPNSGETDSAVGTTAKDTAHRVDKGFIAHEWLTEFAGRIGVSLHDLISAMTHNNEGTYITFGTDAYGEIPDEAWDHYQKYTGNMVKDSQRATMISCAC